MFGASTTDQSGPMSTSTASEPGTVCGGKVYAIAAPMHAKTLTFTKTLISFESILKYNKVK